MLLLVLGLVLFLGVHTVPLFAPAWRAAAVRRLGENGWKGVFALVAIAGVVLIAIGYGQARQAPIALLWAPPLWTRHLAVTLLLPAFVLLVAPYTGRNHLRSRLGHPMLLGLKLWALAHLIANGFLHDVVLFGSFLVWGVLAFTRARRRDRAAGVVPPAPTWRGTAAAVVVGAVLWALFAFHLHAWLFGVSPL